MDCKLELDGLYATLKRVVSLVGICFIATYLIAWGICDATTFDAWRGSLAGGVSGTLLSELAMYAAYKMYKR